MEFEFINIPVEYNWTEEEIRQEFKKSPDKKKIAKMFCIETKDLNRILKGK